MKNEKPLSVSLDREVPRSLSLSVTFGNDDEKWFWRQPPWTAKKRETERETERETDRDRDRERERGREREREGVLGVLDEIIRDSARVSTLLQNSNTETD